MSESGAGTDVLGMSTTATPTADNKGFIINGSKMWITNGTLSGTDTGDIFLLYAKTGKGRGVGDLTSFLGAEKIISTAVKEEKNEKTSLDLFYLFYPF